VWVLNLTRWLQPPREGRNMSKGTDESQGPGSRWGLPDAKGAVDYLAVALIGWDRGDAVCR